MCVIEVWLNWRFVYLPEVTLQMKRVTKSFLLQIGATVRQLRHFCITFFYRPLLWSSSRKTCSCVSVSHELKRQLGPKSSCTPSEWVTQYDISLKCPFKSQRSEQLKMEKKELNDWSVEMALKCERDFEIILTQPKVDVTSTYVLIKIWRVEVRFFPLNFMWLRSIHSW